MYAESFLRAGSFTNQKYSMVLPLCASNWTEPCDDYNLTGRRL